MKECEFRINSDSHRPQGTLSTIINTFQLFLYTLKQQDNFIVDPNVYIIFTLESTKIKNKTRKNSLPSSLTILFGYQNNSKLYTTL